MEFRDPLRNRAHRVLVHLARGNEPVEHPVLGQTPHLDRVLDGLRILAMHLRSKQERFLTLENREYSEIHPRRQTRVKTYLLAAEVISATEFRVVEEREAHRFLHLVNEIAGEEDVGNVRLLELDARGRIRVELG